MKHLANAAVTLLLFALAACGDPNATDGDGDGDADCEADTVPWEPEPPAPPAAEPAPPELPRLRSWVCPERWLPVQHETELDELGEPFSWCEPPPAPRLRVGDYITALEEGEAEGDRPICEPAVDGTFPVLGYAECQPLGDPCPADDEEPYADVPAELPGGRVYVLADAVGEETGTEAAPFRTIGAAVAAAAEGDIIVIGRGTYAETVTIDKNLTLWGRCVQDTIIDAPGPAATPLYPRGAVSVPAGVAATLRNLRITGEKFGVLSRGDTAVEGLWVSGATATGIGVYAGRIVISNTLVEGPSTPELKT